MAEKSKDAERAELTFHCIFDTRASVCLGSCAYLGVFVPFMIAYMCGRAHACACARMCARVCVCVCGAKAEMF